MTTQVGIAVVVGLAATVDDLARRQIANWIPAAALAGGFGWQIGQAGWAGALHALAGAAAGFGVFLIFYLLGGMGGGDVKLMAGFGALLGTGRLLEAALWTAGVGGVVAAGAVGWQWLGRRLRSGKRMETAVEKGRGDSIPYAPLRSKVSTSGQRRLFLWIAGFSQYWASVWCSRWWFRACSTR
jgi:prepilin peptidase CpaA